MTALIYALGSVEPCMRHLTPKNISTQVYAETIASSSFTLRGYSRVSALFCPMQINEEDFSSGGGSSVFSTQL